MWRQTKHSRTTLQGLNDVAIMTVTIFGAIILIALFALRKPSYEELPKIETLEDASSATRPRQRERDAVEIPKDLPPLARDFGSADHPDSN
jgi:hypothetical protein